MSERSGGSERRGGGGSDRERDGADVERRSASKRSRHHDDADDAAEEGTADFGGVQGRRGGVYLGQGGANHDVDERNDYEGLDAFGEALDAVTAKGARAEARAEALRIAAERTKESAERLEAQIAYARRSTAQEEEQHGAQLHLLGVDLTEEEAANFGKRGTPQRAKLLREMEEEMERFGVESVQLKEGQGGDSSGSETMILGYHNEVTRDECFLEGKSPVRPPGSYFNAPSLGTVYMPKADRYREVLFANLFDPATGLRAVKEVARRQLGGRVDRVCGVAKHHPRGETSSEAKHFKVLVKPLQEDRLCERVPKKLFLPTNPGMPPKKVILFSPNWVCRSCARWARENDRDEKVATGHTQYQNGECARAQGRTHARGEQMETGGAAGQQEEGEAPYV